MPLLLLLLGFLAPRVVIVLLVLFSDIMGHAYQGLLIPLLGFFLLPATTLAYALAVYFGGGVHGPFWVLVMVVAVVLDLGSWRWGRPGPR